MRKPLKGHVKAFCGQTVPFWKIKKHNQVKQPQRKTGRMKEKQEVMMWYSNLTEEFSLVSIQDFGNDRAQAELVECVKFIEFLRFIGFIVFIRWFQSGGR